MKLHSKTPWVWNTYQKAGATNGESKSGFYIVSPPGFDIAQLPITSSMNGEIQGANVRKIVKAVNAHDELVKAITDEIVALQIWIVDTRIPAGIRLGMEISLSKLRLALSEVS